MFFEFFDDNSFFCEAESFWTRNCYLISLLRTILINLSQNMNPTRRRIILLNINLLTLTNHPKPRLPPFLRDQTSIIRSLIRILNRLVLPHTLPAYREKVLVRVKCLLGPDLSKTDDGQTS